MRTALRILAAGLALAMTLSASGCWDSREVNSLFIVTGMAIDVGEQPGQARFTAQIARIAPSANAGGGSGGSGGGSPVILLGTDADTALNALANFDRMTSRTPYLHHNQVVAFGADLAERGIEPYIDFMLRDHESREELPLIITEGKAADVLSAEMDQDRVSGTFLARLLADMGEISKYYNVRVFDFASLLLDGFSSAVVPIVQLVDQGGKANIEMSGMAVFKGGKMVGRLSLAEAQGFIWAMGEVNKCIVSVTTEKGVANMYILDISTRRTMEVSPDGTVAAHLRVTANLVLGEALGFEGMCIEELLPYLTEQTQRMLCSRIIDCVYRARAMDADIYRFSETLHRQHPQVWHSMSARWNQAFREVVVRVEAQANIRETGQIVQSLEMEDGRP
ncbi:MAG: Ger(x)C family spore germination protein [Clostridiales bacterium]|nr:Ger(x)C family spore germination protein [Clostridiales bacterium]